MNPKLQALPGLRGFLDPQVCLPLLVNLSEEPPNTSWLLTLFHTISGGCNRIFPQPSHGVPWERLAGLAPTVPFRVSVSAKEHGDTIPTAPMSGVRTPRGHQGFRVTDLDPPCLIHK